MVPPAERVGNNAPPEFNGLPHGIPVEMREIPRWVNYRYWTPPQRDADAAPLAAGERWDEPESQPWQQNAFYLPPLDWSKPRPPGPKPRKLPVTPAGESASSTDPSTWSTLEDCLESLADRKSHGVGFVLTAAAGIVCVDLDGSLYLDADGQLQRREWAHAVLATLPDDAWLERSPGGWGEHVFVRGVKPGGACKVAAPDDWGDASGGAVEAYSDRRFIALTGNRLVPDTHTVG